MRDRILRSETRIEPCAVNAIASYPKIMHKSGYKIPLHTFLYRAVSLCFTNNN